MASISRSHFWREAVSLQPLRCQVALRLLHVVAALRVTAQRLSLGDSRVREMGGLRRWRGMEKKTAELKFTAHFQVSIKLSVPVSYDEHLTSYLISREGKPGNLYSEF